MKKLIKVLVVAIMSVSFASSVQAAGAISDAEQGILNELNAGVTAGGGTFYFDASYISQAENELKAQDYDAATCNTVIGHIQAARQLVVDNSKGITATSLNNLLGQLPKSVQDQINNHILEAAKALGVSVSSNGTVVSKSGKTAVTTKGKSNPIVKTTGANYTVNSLVFVLLMTGTLGMAVVGKKYSVGA